jgi:hypothetical protein
MIDSVKLNSITIYEHKIDLKLYGLTFKVGKCTTKAFFLIIEIQFDYESKYIAQVIYNKKIHLSKQKVITKMMNHNSQILSSKTLHFCKLIFFISIEMEVFHSTLFV